MNHNEHNLDRELLTTTMQKTQTSLKNMINHLEKVDHTNLYELDYRLKNNPDLLKKFIENPQEVIEKETGIKPLEGTHYHFINEKNEYFPPEGSAEQQLMFGHENNTEGQTKPWGRVELRFAIGPGCIAVCGICGIE
ncbi:hypothetical protein [Bacillus multifaciens]|uniref:hypothetical protein n=1 Tax=Bacillus multifaciens TaxID=3068506 RepID=UPI0027423792|nr:hypothetical protein [Bacillus sp. WLY-B-L8]MDP7981531.1 hypothetical protein [Bacillus sp. WLY-B-L8]